MYYDFITTYDASQRRQNGDLYEQILHQKTNHEKYFLHNTYMFSALNHTCLCNRHVRTPKR